MMSSDNRPTRVVDIIDQYRCVINKGSEDGVETGQRYLVYGYGKELRDPDTNELLGVLEIVKGRGKVSHLQQRIATIETYEKDIQSGKITRRSNGLGAFGEVREEVGNSVQRQFEGVKVGDYAKPI